MEEDKLIYEKTHKLEPLSLVTVIVNEGQGNFYRELFTRYESSLVFSTFGTGTATLVSELFASTAKGKILIFGIIKTSKWEQLKAEIESRFNVSKAAKGVAFIIPIDSVAGITIYKYLTNNRKNEKTLLKKTRIKRRKRDGK